MRCWGGGITVESQLGEGSTFSFTLPLQLDQRAEGVLEPPFTQAGGEEERSLAGARVLLVEDNQVNQMVAKGLLDLVGVEVDVVEHGVAAIEYLSERADSLPDLVLMDIQMPVMDGYEASRRLRADSRFNNLPIIAMTANAMRGDREKAIQAGMNDHLTKPIDVDLLYQQLLHWRRKTTC